MFRLPKSFRALSTSQHNSNLFGFPEYIFLFAASVLCIETGKHYYDKKKNNKESEKKNITIDCIYKLKENGPITKQVLNDIVKSSIEKEKIDK